MELKLVYRALRKISDWTITGYYSETYVEGQENVPKDGPLIIASTHHNEIIDIATLAATMPHRRHLSFWAKSTMFANPITRGILSSSGAIPVRRNLDSGSTTTSDPSSSSSAAAAAKDAELASRSALFRDTSKALAANQVVGVFPEGTSYTQSSIMQIMPGAAWAAVEYARYVHENANEIDPGTKGGKGKEKAVDVLTRLRIVPVAIVYTDKSRYQSRIYVKYGEPILVDSYAAELFEGDPDTASKAVVKKIMAQVERQLKEMTINAPDWDTTCAVSMARSILWGEEQNVPLKDWVEISQRLVQMLVLTEEASTSERNAIADLKVALSKYYALLHYAGVRHSILLSLLPLSSSSLLDIPPPNTIPSSAMLIQPTLSVISSLPLSLIRLILFLPPLLLHFPGYITGRLADKCLVRPGQDESLAQFKAVGGGLGIGANIALTLGVLWKANNLGPLAAFLDKRNVPLLKRVLGLVSTIYCSVWMLVKWHKLLVNGEFVCFSVLPLLTTCIANYRQLQRLLTYHKLVSTFAFPRGTDRLSTAEADAYSKPPLPAANMLIKKREASNADENTSEAPTPIASRRLVRQLLLARTGACAALSAHLMAREDKTLLAFLLSKGARISVS